MAPSRDYSESLSPHVNGGGSSFRDDADDSDAISKLDLDIQANGRSPDAPSSTVSPPARPPELIFINYAPANDRVLHRRVTSATNLVTPHLDAVGDVSPSRHRRSRSSAARHSPYSRRGSRDLTTSIDRAFQEFRDSIDHAAATPSSSVAVAPPTTAASNLSDNTDAAGPFPVLTPQSGIPPGSAGPDGRCPTCGGLQPLRPAPPLPPSHRRRANAALARSPPFRLQSPPSARPPWRLLRTHTSPSLPGNANNPQRRRAQSDTQQANFDATTVAGGRLGSSATTNAPRSPPHTPRLRPSPAIVRVEQQSLLDGGLGGVGVGGVGVGAAASAGVGVVAGVGGLRRSAGSPRTPPPPPLRRSSRTLDEFEGLMEQLRNSYAVEDRAGRRAMRADIEGVLVKRSEGRVWRG